MIASFGRRYAFSALHRLHSDALSAQENRDAYGKCNNPHGHGHNYIVEVVVRGPVDAQTGMVINLVDLDSVVHDNVLSRFDHNNLNLDPLFATEVPTTENLCQVIHNLLGPALARIAPNCRLARLRVEETENNFFQIEE